MLNFSSHSIKRSDQIRTLVRRNRLGGLQVAVVSGKHGDSIRDPKANGNPGGAIKFRVWWQND